MKNYLCAFVFLLSFFSCSENIENVKPNILFIMSDDHAYQAISAYDTRLIQTPNIDRIANEGILFSNASVTNSICAPSRAVILTGKHSHLNGKIDNGKPFDTTQVTFPQLFQKAGYQTAMFGKLHFGNNPKGVDDFLILPGQGSYINPKFIGKKKEIKEQQQDSMEDQACQMVLLFVSNNPCLNRIQSFHNYHNLLQVPIRH